MLLCPGKRGLGWTDTLKNGVAPYLTCNSLRRKFASKSSTFQSLRMYQPPETKKSFKFDFLLSNMT